MNISKYFWDLNEKALKETPRILRNPKHPKFIIRIVTFLSRCDQPKNLFSLISKKDFIKNWPKIKSYWVKIMKESDFRDWWDTLYEQLLQKYRIKEIKPTGKASALFVKIGSLIKNTRVQRGWSQKELALRSGMKQPDISKIEDGKKNITIQTLASLCKILEIKKLELWQ